MCVVFSLWNSMTFAKVTQDCELVINGRCTDCNSLAGFEINTDETCKALCPNRKVFYPWRQKYCALEECPQEYPVRDEEYGHCSKEKIEQQDMYKQEFKEIDATDKKYAVGTKTGKCPPDKPLLSGSRCYPCDYPLDVRITKDFEKLCPERISIPYPWINDNTTITYMPCPEDKPLRSWYGKCFSCDYPDVVRVITQCLEDDKLCDVCPNRIILPQAGGNRPSILKCPSDKPLTDVKGICFSCDIEIPIETVKDGDCEKYCPSKRKSLNNYCVKLENNTK